MPHRGELLLKIVKQTKTKKTALARHLKISRNQLYNWFADPELSLDILIEAGKFMHYDFGSEVPELAQKPITPKDQENLDYRLKYFELSEKLIQVMEERETYRKRLEDKNKDAK